MQKINTGNYKLYKDQTGIANTKTLISEHNSRDEIIQVYNEIQKDLSWCYFCEEEVFYRGTMFDENGNPVDTKPGWVRMHI